MSSDKYIQSFCKIKNNQIIVDDNVLFNDTSKELKSFLKEAYKALALSYPKFFKMDSLSKLAFLGVEYLLNGNVVAEDTALIFSNNASSLDTDRLHQTSIDDLNNYYPSPAVFVYTLPNIGVGEISIRHQLKSENAFFIFDRFNAQFHHAYESSLMDQEKCNSVIGGWVNVDKDNYDVFLYLVSEKGSTAYTEQNLIDLYNK